ncbi:MAG: hypothetical protein ACC618_00275 [Patescibacteria group bacterium]
MIILVGALFGAILGLFFGDRSFEIGFKIGNLFVILVTLSLSFAILSKKNLMSNFGLILLAVLSGLLTLLGGGLLGLIPAAYLSTKKKA